MVVKKNTILDKIPTIEKTIIKSIYRSIDLTALALLSLYGIAVTAVAYHYFTQTVGLRESLLKCEVQIMELTQHINVLLKKINLLSNEIARLNLENSLLQNSFSFKVASLMGTDTTQKVVLYSVVIGGSLVAVYFIVGINIPFLLGQKILSGIDALCLSIAPSFAKVKLYKFLDKDGFSLGVQNSTVDNTASTFWVASKDSIQYDFAISSFWKNTETIKALTEELKVCSIKIAISQQQILDLTQDIVLYKQYIPSSTVIEDSLTLLSKGFEGGF